MGPRCVRGRYRQRSNREWLLHHCQRCSHHHQVRMRRRQRRPLLADPKNDRPRRAQPAPPREQTPLQSAPPLPCSRKERFCCATPERAPARTRLHACARRVCARTTTARNRARARHEPGNQVPVGMMRVRTHITLKMQDLTRPWRLTGVCALRGIRAPRNTPERRRPPGPPPRWNAAKTTPSSLSSCLVPYRARLR